MYVLHALATPLNIHLHFYQARGPVQEFDFDDSEDEDLPAGINAVPPSDGSDDSDDDEAPITGKNIESRSRALDKQAALNAVIDEEEMQQNAIPREDGEEDIEMFELPTAAQREEEKKGDGPDVQEVQRRMQECARVLGDLKRFGSKGRCVHKMYPPQMGFVTSYG